MWEGSYRVQFSPSGGPRQYAYQQTDSSSADVFTVTAGATTTVDDTLMPVGTITGRVTNQGAPVSFATIQVLDSTSQFDQQVGSTFTSFDGTYRVGVLPGTYKVKIRFPSGISQYAHQQTSLAAADTFTVAEGETIVVDEAALVPSTIRGTLTNADGTPAMGAFVSVRSATGFLRRRGRPHRRVVGLSAARHVHRFVQHPTRHPVGIRQDLRRRQPTRSSWARAPQWTSTTSCSPPGSVTVTATDHATGAPLTSFCVNHNFGGSCTSTGSITVTARAGDFWVNVYTEDQVYIGAAGHRRRRERAGHAVGGEHG